LLKNAIVSLYDLTIAEMCRDWMEKRSPFEIRAVPVDLRSWEHGPPFLIVPEGVSPFLSMLVSDLCIELWICIW
jgi:hypothetical protein